MTTSSPNNPTMQPQAQYPTPSQKILNPFSQLSVPSRPPTTTFFLNVPPPTSPRSSKLPTQPQVLHPPTHPAVLNPQVVKLKLPLKASTPSPNALSPFLDQFSTSPPPTPNLQLPLATPSPQLLNPSLPMPQPPPLCCLIPLFSSSPPLPFHNPKTHPPNSKSSTLPPPSLNPPLATLCLFSAPIQLSVLPPPFFFKSSTPPPPPPNFKSATPSRQPSPQKPQLPSPKYM
uniref:uncharacterized protein n=1 Tax=Myxine glutinosa TaxID=7769 RepID=UPI00358FBA57